MYRNALGPLGDLTYQYDAGGNRISVGGSFARTLVPDAVGTATYDAANRQLAFGPTAQTFDDNGNLLTQTDPSGTMTYAWDARNRLTAMTGPSVNASFAYDGLGRRTQKTIDSVTTAFRYDGPDVAQESTSGGNVTYLRTLSIDEALARTDGVETAHYLGDALGSSVELTNSAGASATTYTYEPFGRTEISGIPSANPFQYTGRENDGTGLYYYRARYYDPWRSRFVQADPIGFAAGDTNIYTYGANNPVNVTDPKGTGPIMVCACVAYMLYDAYSTIETLKQLQREIDEINKEIAETQQQCSGDGVECLERIEALKRQGLEKGRIKTVELAKGAVTGIVAAFVCTAAASPALP